MKGIINLDNARLFAACLIVALHTYPFENISPTFDILFTHIFCRMAVPLFLMITGYFLLPKALSNKSVLIEYSKKILKLYFICIMIYLPVNIYTGNYQTMHIIKEVFIRGTFYHLWYFPALLFGIWFSYFLLRFFKLKTVGFISIFLYIIGLLGDSYYGITQYFNGLKVLYDVIFTVFDYTRNGLLYVPIFLYMGYRIAIKTNSKSKKRDGTLAVICLCLMELEGYIVYHFKLVRHDSMYVFLLPVMYFLFNYLLAYKTGANKKIRSLATTIYIIHPLIMIIIKNIAKLFQQETFILSHHFIYYVCIMIVTIITSFTIEKGREKIKNAINRRKKQFER